MALTSFGSDLRVAVIGASGGIGAALCRHLAADPSVSRVWACARHPERVEPAEKIAAITLDLEDESTIVVAAERIATDDTPLSLVIVATGFLHDKATAPEKTWRKLSVESFQRNFAVNTIGPALVAKHFLDLMVTDRKSVFAAMSARVGSIGDNRAGGWHAYRAAKAALNMVIKTLSIELGWRRPDSVCIGLHPGTVETALSAPFRRNVPDNKLFTPDVAASHLLRVVDGVTPLDSGSCFAWDGKRIDP